MNTVDVYVRYSCGAYVTNTLNGVRTSSTSGAEQAARTQAEKLFGPALQNVQRVDAEGQTSVWRVTADADKVAWCWATGLIEFGDEVPENAVKIASGPDRALRELVQVVARHAKPRSDGQLLVPGVPEASSEDDAFEALSAWLGWCGKCHPKGHKRSFGVEFVVVPRVQIPARVPMQRADEQLANPAMPGRVERLLRRLERGLA